VRQIKANRIAEARVERCELFNTFEILRALTLIEGESSDTVVFLFDQFLLEECFCFRFVAEMLPIAPLPQFRPCDTVEWVSFDLALLILVLVFFILPTGENVRSCRKLPVRWAKGA
jgi:hypothetical protein